MKTRILKSLALAGTLLSGLFGLTPAVSAEATGDPIVVGVLEDRSSSGAFYSQESSKALKAFVEAVNKGELLYAAGQFDGKPGIMGRPIKLLFEDDQSNPNLSTAKARSLVEQGAQMLIFITGSAATIQGKVVCTEEKIFCIAPTNVNDKIVQAPNNEFIFTVVPPAALSAKTIVDAWKDTGYKKIGFFSESTATSKPLLDTYVKTMTEAGFEAAAVEIMEAGARDASPQLLRIMESKPDVLLDLTNHAPSTVTLFRSYQRLSLEVPRWSAIGITAQPQIWAESGDSIDGLTVVDMVNPTKPNLVAVRDLYHAAVGSDQPWVWLHPAVWDGLMLTKYAVEKAGTVDGAAVVAAMEQVADFPMAHGQEGYTVSFGGKHNGSGPKAANIVVFEGGKPAKLWDKYQP